MQRYDSYRNVVVTVFLSIDGVMEAPENWHKTYHEADVQAFKHEELFASDALLLGRTTYEIFADAWPTRTDDSGFADRMNGIKKYVVSTTLTNHEWTNTTVIDGDVVPAVRKLKAEPGNDLLVCGSGQLVRTLMQHNLIDELRLLIDPVILGSGEKLFPDDGSPTSLSLVDSRPFASGSVLLTYYTGAKGD